MLIYYFNPLWINYNFGKGCLFPQILRKKMNIHTYNLYKNGLFIPWLKAGIQSFYKAIGGALPCGIKNNRCSSK
jgi:hypothetical protein